VEFRILGPLEVADDGEPVAIRRGKEQALLAYLLLHANEVISSGRLIDVLWDEQPPATAAKILHNAVSHLRRQLGDGRLLTRDPGYLLRVEPGELDAHEFERLAKEGRAAEALALWRGPALLNLHDERFAEEARRRLDEQRLAVLEDRIDADLSAGRDSELVPELEDLIASHPLRERLQGQLMTALYRAGRQADALEAYQRARRRLSAELGLEPGPQLQELERKILKQDAELASPPPRTRTPQPASVRLRRLALLGIAAVPLAAATVVGLVYVFNGNGSPIVVKPNSLAVIDPSRNRVVGVVPVGSTPRGLAVDSNSVWVTNSADGTVSQVDVKTLKVMRTIGIAAQASDAVEADGRVWVATGSDNTLVSIDARSGGVQERLKLSDDPSASAYALAAEGGVLWVASGNRLLKVDQSTNTIVSGRGAQAHFGVHDVAVGAGAIWLADTSETVARLSPRDGRVTGLLHLGEIPASLQFGYGAVWVVVPEPNRPMAALWRVDPGTVRVTQTISIGKQLTYLPTFDIAIGAGAIWVTNFDAGTVVRVDPRTLTVVAKIHVGNHPSGIKVGADRVWVTVS
jgi:YVTN family beta-propeller protein